MSDLKALTVLEAEAGRLLAELSDAGRRDILRRIVQDLKKSQAARLKAQLSPDGLPFAPRKFRRPPKAGRGARRFLYPSGGNGPPRVVFMKSWSYDGPLMTGYDIEAQGIRSFETKKIIKYLGVSPAEDNQNTGAPAAGGPIRRRTKIKQKAMFRKLRTGRYLKGGVTSTELWVGFVGQVVGLARVHQYGLKDRATKHGRAVKYTQRELLGFSEAEREAILEFVTARL